LIVMLALRASIRAFARSKVMAFHRSEGVNGRDKPDHDD
jgi:hypothetical protein